MESMETNSQSTPSPDPSKSAPSPYQSAPPAPLDPAAAPSKQRRRRKKQFPEMVPSQSLRRFRALRPHASRPSVIYNEKLLDRLIRRQINFSASYRRRRSQLNDLNTESLIALAVGFPIDSLTEEEIEANVLPLVGNPRSQANYITARNYILSLFRCNPSNFLTKEQSAASILSEHRRLVTTAYSFLQSHAYINFGVLNIVPLSLPAIPPTGM